MIKIEHEVFVPAAQMAFLIEGMRNPMNSWEMSDSTYGTYYGKDSDGNDILDNSTFSLGQKDRYLMVRLAKTGSDHRKFMRMMNVYVRITAPLYWWKEFDTYKVGTVSNSCSTMHKITEKEFTIADFSHEHLDGETRSLFTDGNLVKDDGTTGTYNCSAYDFMCITCDVLNHYRDLYLITKDKKYWWQMIQLLPSSYNQTRNVSLNYEVLANIYNSRKDHKLDEWREFCKWIEKIPYAELITGE